MVALQYRHEPLAYLMQNGLPELAVECWEKVGDAFHSNVFAPDWKSYAAQEEDRSLGFIAMRERETLVGYAVIKTNKDIHNQHLTAALLHDIYIVEKRRGYAIQFMHEIEKLCRLMGCDYLDGAENLLFDQDRGGAGKFYQFMGFVPAEVVWRKKLVIEGNA